MEPLATMDSWAANVVAICLSLVSLLGTAVAVVMHYASTRSDVRDLGTVQAQHGKRIEAIETRESQRDAMLHRMDKSIALLCQKMGVSPPTDE